MKQRRKTRKRLPLVSKLGLVLLAALVLFNGYTLARYITEEKNHGLYVARAFYLTADYLRPQNANGKYEAYHLKDGVDSISFTLRNYDDDLRTSEVPVSYVVYLNGEKKEDGTLSGNGKSTEIITLSDLSAGKYTVTVEATAPYTKTIGAEFTLYGTNDNLTVTRSGSAGESVMLMTVATNDYSGDVTLSWPSAVYPDKTDPLLENAGGTSVTLNMPSNAEYTFRFFKSDLTQDYTGQLNAVKSN